MIRVIIIVIIMILIILIIIITIMIMYIPTMCLSLSVIKSSANLIMCLAFSAQGQFCSPTITINGFCKASPK